MSLTPKPIKALEVFFSYAHKDQHLRDQLETRLSILKREGFISSWHDRKIGAGVEWAGKIDTHATTLGRAYEVLGQKKQAIGYYKQALEIHREVKDREGEGAMLNNLGLVYNALGKKQEALSYFEQALSILREVGDRGGEGVTLHNTGTLYFEWSRYEVALACFLLARGIFEEVQSPNRDVTQRRIDALHKAVGEQQYATLLAQVELQARQIVERALREGLC